MRVRRRQIFFCVGNKSIKNTKLNIKPMKKKRFTKNEYFFAAEIVGIDKEMMDKFNWKEERKKYSASLKDKKGSFVLNIPRFLQKIKKRMIIG